MPPNEASPRLTFWGSLTCLQAAAMGLIAAAGGALSGSNAVLFAGAALFVAAIFAYLAFQLRATFARRRSKAEDNTGWVFEPEETSPTGSGTASNFEHLLTHTLEGSETPVPSSFAPRPATGAAPPQSFSRIPVLTNGETSRPETPMRHYEQAVRSTAVQRRRELVKDLPIVKEIFGDEATVVREDRPGKTRGQCSGCGTILWAPAVRPIRLRCPKCGRSATLEA